MTVGEVLRRSTEHLAERGSPTPRLDAELLLAAALGLSRVELYMGIDRTLTTPELDAARALVARRSRREPLQYVLGEWGFRRLTLSVDPRALIPRPETEILVERALARLAGSVSPTVLDVGTGSGAVALAVADEHPGAQVTAIDSSTEALALAAENAARTGIEVVLAEHDLLDGLPPGPWDVVVSNPPYVRPSEVDDLEPEVGDWEPASALVAAGHTEALVHSAPAVLAAGGALVLETHRDDAVAVAGLLQASGFDDVVVTQDLAGRDRVVDAILP